ncbi:MAG: hypothetical protein Q9M91_05340 [Candidatus Dojkabacteria bacterium]|nr:hypothetical protein [Candidatus Dojkabacteria bacterium]MDQ7021227.1 hypothetical protein [Candidatus Dojkabacteria bacterium]
MATKKDDAQVPEGDKVAEYFQVQKTLKTLRKDLKEIKEQHPDYQELQTINKKVKELRDNINNDDEIKTLKDKVGQLKERHDLIKELIRIDLIETSTDHVKKEGKALKLVYVLKEVKEDDA